MKTAATLCATLALLLGTPAAQAGPYGDDLSKCLVSSTSDAERTVLMKWIFSAIALHKDAAPYVDMPADVRAGITRDAAGMFMTLLTERCKAQTHEAFKYEGQAAIGNAFQVLGQVASQGLFTDPAVAAGLADLTGQVDADKLKAVLEGP